MIHIALLTHTHKHTHIWKSYWKKVRTEATTLGFLEFTWSVFHLQIYNTYRYIFLSVKSSELLIRHFESVHHHIRNEKQTMYVQCCMFCKIMLPSDKPPDSIESQFIMMTCCRLKLTTYHKVWKPFNLIQ
jgi:hypothetical protein